MSGCWASTGHFCQPFVREPVPFRVRDGRAGGCAPAWRVASGMCSLQLLVVGEFGHRRLRGVWRWVRTCVGKLAGDAGAWKLRGFAKDVAVCAAWSKSFLLFLRVGADNVSFTLESRELGDIFGVF